MMNTTIDVLDYHAAHAPAMPEWFKCNLPNPKSHPGPFHVWVKYGKRLTDDEFELIEKYSIGQDWQDDDAPTELIEKWDALWVEWQQAEEQYQLDMNHYHITKLVQWRIFYANKMVETIHPLNDNHFVYQRIDGQIKKVPVEVSGTGQSLARKALETLGQKEEGGEV